MWIIKVCGKKLGSCLLSGGCNPNGKDWVEFVFGKQIGDHSSVGSLFFWRGGYCKCKPCKSIYGSELIDDKPLNSNRFCSKDGGLNFPCRLTFTPRVWSYVCWELVLMDVKISPPPQKRNRDIVWVFEFIMSGLVKSGGACYTLLRPTKLDIILVVCIYS